MPGPIRLPITILTTQAGYTANVAFGNSAASIALLLDTGSAMLVVDGMQFDPIVAGCSTTLQLQQAAYLSMNILCAVVRGRVAFDAATSVQQANIGVTYNDLPVFGGAGGIWGLAFGELDIGLQMPGDTWAAQYDASDLMLGKACDLAPLFDQATEAGTLARKFAFRVRRAVPSMADANAAADPLNTGIFVLGGGTECADLLTGPVSNIAVVAEHFYNVNLLSVQVGPQPPIPVAALPAGSKALSTAFIDSGVTNLALNQDVYDAVIGSFNALNPDFGAALAQPGVDQTLLDLASWPYMRFTFQAAGGGTTNVAVGARAYWQFDAGSAGRAQPMLQGDGHRLGGQSILGLPFFVDKYVIFDRTGPAGRARVTVS